MNNPGSIEKYTETKYDTFEENSQKSETKELTFIWFLELYWRGRFTILVCFVVSSVIGMILMFGTRTEYSSKAVLLPEASETNNISTGVLGQFGLGGFNLPNNGETASLNPQLYPQIVTSNPFLLDLSSQDYKFHRPDTVTNLLIYFTEILEPTFANNIINYTLGLPNLMLSSEDKNEISYQYTTDSTLVLSESTKRVLEEVNERLLVEVTKSDGTVILTGTMPEPEASARLVAATMNQLIEYLVDYRTQKHTNTLRFANNQYLSAKERFESIQFRLANFRDKNSNLISAKAQTELESLQREYDMASEVYSTMAQQFENAKLKLQEQTPVFKVLEPATVPLNKSEPKRKLIFAITILATLLVASVIIFSRESLKKVNFNSFKN